MTHQFKKYYAFLLGAVAGDLEGIKEEIKHLANALLPSYDKIYIITDYDTDSCQKVTSSRLDYHKKEKASEVKDLLKNLFSTIESESFVWFYYIGHGHIKEKDNKQYYNWEPNEDDGTFSEDDIHALFSNSNISCSLRILDACSSKEQNPNLTFKPKQSAKTPWSGHIVIKTALEGGTSTIKKKLMENLANYILGNNNISFKKFMTENKSKFPRIEEINTGLNNNKVAITSSYDDVIIIPSYNLDGTYAIFEFSEENLHNKVLNNELKDRIFVHLLKSIDIENITKTANQFKRLHNHPVDQKPSNHWIFVFHARKMSDVGLSILVNHEEEYNPVDMNEIIKVIGNLKMGKKHVVLVVDYIADSDKKDLREKLENATFYHYTKEGFDIVQLLAKEIQ